MRSVDARIIRGAGVVVATALVVRSVGFIREILVARDYGRSEEFEIFLAALAIPALVGGILGGAFHQVVLPICARLRSRGDEAAAAGLYGCAAGLGSLVLTVLAGAMMLIPEPLAGLVGGGFDPHKLERTAITLRHLAPMTILSALALILAVPLHLRERFFVTTVASVSTSLTVIVALAITPQPDEGTLATATLLGASIEVTILVLGARLAGHRFSLSAPGLGRELTGTLVQGTPLVIGMALQSCMTLVDQGVAGRLDAGSLATWSYANRLVMIPTTLLALAVANVCLPVLSSELADHGRSALLTLFRRWLWRVLGLGLVAAAAVWLFAPLVVEAVYRRGEFSAADAQAVSDLLRAYAILIPVYVGGMLAAKALAALERNQFLGWVGAVNLGLTVVLNLVLVPVLGLAAIAVTAVIVYAVSCAWMSLAVASSCRGEGRAP